MERGDIESLHGTLSPGVTLHSPVLFKPFVGVDSVSAVLSAVVRVLATLRYTNLMEGESTSALRFTAHIEDREVGGIDLLDFDHEGKISHITVFMRPLSAINEFSAGMGRMLGADPGW